MKWSSANAVVEQLRADTRLYLPALSQRRGFSSSRVEHLLQQMVAAMPSDEGYLEVGTLEGRTLEAAASANGGKKIYACDPGGKYGVPELTLPHSVTFYPQSWEQVLPRLSRIGCVFYDADHSAESVESFMVALPSVLADEAILVLDDWDRASMRSGAFSAATVCSHWTLLRELPEYTDGLTAPPNHFGYYFGVAVWGYRSSKWKL